MNQREEVKGQQGTNPSKFLESDARVKSAAQYLRDGKQGKTQGSQLLFYCNLRDTSKNKKNTTILLVGCVESQINGRY